ncbi:MAG: T9SS type A sorting domain-containing protein [Bacteroidia bacterium]
MKFSLFLFLWVAAFFAVAQPSITYPPTNAVDIRLKTLVQWSYNLTDLNEYQLDTNTQFNSPLFQTGSSVAAAVYFKTLRFNTRYYLRARTIFKTSGDTTNWSSVRNFRTLDTFEMTSPTNNSVGHYISLTWYYKSSGAMTRIFIDTTPDFNSPALIDTLIKDSANMGAIYPTTKPFESKLLYFNKKHYIRGYAYNQNDSIPMSGAYSFSTRAYPTIQSPGAGASNISVWNTPTYSFVTSSTSDTNITYEVRIDTSSQFDSPLKVLYTRKYPQTAMRVLLHYGKLYKIQVRAIHANDTSNWCPASNFSTASTTNILYPYLTGSDTLLKVDSVHFMAYGNGEATRIEFMLDTIVTLNSPALLADTMAAKDGRKTVKNLFFRKRYYAAARIISSIDTSEWTYKSYSTISFSPLLRPYNNSTLEIPGPELSWTALKNQTGYTILLDTVNTFDSQVLIRLDSNSSVAKVNSPDLMYYQQYYWKMKLNTINDSSDWTPVWKFKTSPMATYINTPYNNQTNMPVNPTYFNWEEPSGTKGYHYQVSTDSLFTNPINRYVLGQSNSFDNLNGLAYNTKYFFRVRCFNKVDTADWYYENRFYTMPEPPKPAIPVLQLPANNAINQNYSQTQLTWLAAANTNSYDIEASTSPQFFSPITGNTSNLYVYLTGLSPSTTYYWHVRGINTYKTGDWSNTFNFTTLDQLLPPTNLSPNNFEARSPVTCILTWTANPNATYYEYQIGNSPPFSFDPVYQASTNTVTLSNIKPNLTFYYRVRTIVTPYSSAWSDFETFRTWSVGLNDLDESLRFQIYPNPTTGLLFMNDALAQAYDGITIYDPTGKSVMVIDKGRKEIDLSGLAKGLYVLMIQTSSGTYQQRIQLEGSGR